MALTPAAFIAPGCSQQCCKAVAAKPKSFAYASANGLSLYRLASKAVANLAAEAAAAATGGNTPTSSATPPSSTEIVDYSLQTLFGNGVTGTVTAFDYNDDFMACLCAQTNSVVMWKLVDAEPISSKKLPSTLSAAFKREGTPTSMCIAGKHHLIFGTNTGRLVSLNTNEGPHEPKSVAVPPPAQAVGATAAASTQQSVEAVQSIDVSPARADLVACGTADGTLAFFTLSVMTGLTPSASLVPFPPPVKEKERLLAPNALPVSVLAYDPSSPSQIAVGSSEGGLALCDMNQPTAALIIFDTKDKISGIAWVPGESGSFYTVSASSNLVQRWSTTSKTAVSSTAAADSGVGIRGIACIEKERVVLALTNGTVKVINVGATPEAQILEFETPAGHTDAVLTARFSRHDRDLLASAGADGSIRVWNMRSATMQCTIEVGQTMVYSVDWSHNGKYIIAALGTGEVVQYQVATQRQSWQTSVFPDPIYRVAWATVGETNLIVATSRNGVALLSKEGQVVRRFSAPGGAVHCVDIEPTKGKTLAIGCHDHKVYVYSLTSNSDDPVLTLSGHSDVVSDVAYNLSAPQFLLSGSYDGNLRVWDLSLNDSHAISVGARVLKGHADRVTSVVWCSLAPYLALSGAADATVRLWDIRNGVCVTSARGHNADVCAVTSHPERPLLFVSAAKDGSLVAWFLSLLRQVYLEAVLGTLEQCIVPDAVSLMAVATNSNVSVSVVSGAAVQKLVRELKEGSAAAKPAERMEKLIGFFEPPLGTADLAQLATYATDPAGYSTDSRLAPTMVVPTPKLVDTQRAKAKQAAEKARGKTVTSAGPEYKKKRLLAAAEELLRVGHLEDYCNLLMEAEEWDRAIAVAPAISREYWRLVCLAAAAAMEKAGDARAVTYYIIGEESNKAAALMTRLSLSNSDAAAVVSRTCPQRNPGAAADAEPPHQVTVDTNGVSAASQKAQETRLTALYNHHNPRVIAAAHVANGCNDEAVRTLSHAGDVSLAHILVHTVPLRDQQSIDTAYFMSMLLSARLRQWDTAVTCAARQSNPYHSFATLVALFQFTHGKQVSRLPTHSVTSAGMANFQAINDKLKGFYDQVKAECTRLQLPMDAAAIQQRHTADALASQNQLAAMVIQADPVMGPVTNTQTLQSLHGFLESLLTVVLQDADGPNAAFYLKQAYNVAGYVALPISLPHRSGSGTSSNLNSGAAGSPSNNSGGATSAALPAEHKKFLCLCYLLGALLCVKVYRFPTLLNPILVKARELTLSDANLEALAGKVQSCLSTYSPQSIAVDCAPVGVVIPAMGNDGKQLISAVSTQPITGPVHLLEDSSSIMSKEEALAWSMCCQFSPLASGARMAVL